MVEEYGLENMKYVLKKFAFSPEESYKNSVKKCWIMIPIWK